MKGFMKDQHAGFTLLEFIVSLVVAAIIAAMVYTFFGESLTQSGVPIRRLQQTNNLSQVMENIVADYNRLNALNLRYKWRSGALYTVNSVVVPSDSTNNTSSNIVSNGFFYMCTASGTSGTTLPSWSSLTTLNATWTDGTVTWKTLKDGKTTKDIEVWQGPLGPPAGHAYTVGTIVIPTLNNGHYYKCTTAGTSATNEPSSTNTPPNAWPTSPGGTIPSQDGTVTWTEAGTILDSSEANIENLYTYLTTAPGRYDNNSNSYTVVSAETKFIQFNGTTEVDAGTSGTSTEKNILKVTIKNNNSAETLTGIFTIQ